jgi:drug/metabolite transporter (DMT)-like permease
MRKTCLPKRIGTEQNKSKEKNNTSSLTNLKGHLAEDIQLDIKIVPFAALVVGGVLYQLALKRVPAHASPFITLGAVYGFASLACMVAAILLEGVPDLEALGANLNWAVLGVSVGIMLIEGGYLFGFRIGYPISTLMLTTVVCVALVLLVIGNAVFGERLTIHQWAGLILCLVGIALIKSPNQEPTDHLPLANQVAAEERAARDRS